MISHQHQCIFVEVPKTGSTSIREVIGSPPKAHMNICQIRYEMMTYWTAYGGLPNHLMSALYMLWPLAKRQSRGEALFNQYFKFGFVRNPWDRAVSLYNRPRAREMRQRMGFEEFIDWMRYSSSTCNHPVPHTNQLDWLVGPSGDLLVDFIGRYERLEADWATVAARLELPPELPHANPNPLQRKHYSEYYNEHTRQIVAQRFALDIEFFGYQFGD